MSSSEKFCDICGGSISKGKSFCERCKNIRKRSNTRKGAVTDWEARTKALKQAWDRDEGCFRCYYTGVRLLEENKKSPRYPSIEHRTPGDEHDIVIVARCINDMKSDMDENEFKAIVSALAARFKGEEDFEESLLDLKHWRR